jgi:hypothetical protein
MRSSPDLENDGTAPYRARAAAGIGALHIIVARALFRLCTREHNRNNRTFFGGDNGGRTAAVLRSFVTSCELVRVDPFVWFCDVLGRIAEHPVKRLEELLPHRWAQVSR